MADLLLCMRVHEDGRCDHPVTGALEREVVPTSHRVPCSICGHAIRRLPGDHPGLAAACVDHLKRRHAAVSDVYDAPRNWCSLCQAEHSPCEYHDDGIEYWFLTDEEREGLAAME